MENNRKLNMMLDSIFKAISRSIEARSLIASVISELTDIEEDKILKARFVGGEIPKQRKYEKGKISDVIILFDNTIIILEMNYIQTGENFKKNASYAYSIYTQNIKKKDKKTIYPKLYLININNFNEYKTNEAIQYFDFKDQNDVLEDMEGCKSIHLVLDNIIDTRYNKNVPDIIIRYAKFLKATSIEELKEIAKGDKKFMDAVEKVEEFTEDEEFMGLYYDKEERDMLDYYAGIAYSKKLGREQGREEGRIEGRIEGRKEGEIDGHAAGLAEGRAEGLAEGHAEGQATERRNVIRNMANHNFDINQIANILNLNKSEVTKYL